MKCSVAIFFTLEVVLHTLLFVFHRLVLCNAFLSSSVLLHLGMLSYFCLFFVFICMSLFVHFFYGFCFLVMFVGNGGFTK
jgi:hypothetical protein